MRRSCHTPWPEGEEPRGSPSKLTMIASLGLCARERRKEKSLMKLEREKTSFTFLPGGKPQLRFLPSVVTIECNLRI